MGYDKENARKEDCMRPLYDCALFQGLPEAELHAALRFFAAQERACPRGALLKASPAPLHAFGLVLDGRVRVSMTDIDGREMLLSQVGAGQTFGEALCYLQSGAPIIISAASDASILWLRCEGLRRRRKPSWKPCFSSVLPPCWHAAHCK